MEPAPLLLLLSSLWGCSGRPADRLVVTPREPLVQYGGSVQLNCSLACAGGTVQWKGLDTNLGSISSFPTHSILHIGSAVVTTAGPKTCQGTCHGERYQDSVNLKVYALPDRLRLRAEPRVPVPGQPASLRCAAQGVYPRMGLRLTWYWGNKMLEEKDLDVTETDEELFDIVSTLPVAGEEVGEGVEFRCEVTLSIGQETFIRVASVVASTGAVTERPVAMATSTGRPQTAAATTGSPSTAGPVTTIALTPEPRVPIHDPSTALTTPPWEPGAETIPELAAATEFPSTEHPAPWNPGAGSSTARPGSTATTRLPSSGTERPTAEALGTAVGSTDQGSPLAAEGMGPPMGTGSPCSLQIWSLPPNGTQGRALSVECHAQCAGNATVRWLRTPVALSQYREEVVGSGSVLHLDHAEPQHQGHYQCVLLGHRSQVASLQLVVLEDPSSTGPTVTLGTTVSLLGLIVSGVTSHRLWRRFRSRYELP